MLLYERKSETMVRCPPIDPIKQPVELVKMVNMLTLSALIYTTDEEGDRIDDLFRQLHPEATLINGGPSKLHLS